MKIATLSACLLAIAASPAFCSTVTYNLFVDGEDEPTSPLSVGTHTLSVEAIVTDNDLTGDGLYGGLLQSLFDLRASSSIQFQDLEGGLFGGSDGNWDSTGNVAFPTYLPGELENGGSDATGVVGLFTSSQWGTHFADVGANVFSTIARGDFFYDGNSAPTISLDGLKYRQSIRVASLESSHRYGAQPDVVVDDCIYQCPLVPEPPPSNAVVDYRLLIDGVEAGRHDLAPGPHTLSVEVRVADNDILGLPGGLLQSKFSLDDTQDAIRWADFPAGLFGNPDGDGRWDSLALTPPFDLHVPGFLAGSGETEVIAETHLIDPITYNAYFQEVGADEFTLVALGDFNWNGTPTRLDLKVVAPYGGDILVAQFDGVGDIIGGIPHLVNEASTFLGIPEPSALALYGLGLLLMTTTRPPQPEGRQQFPGRSHLGIRLTQSARGSPP